MKIAIKLKEIGGLLPAGQHLVTITEAGIENSAKNEHWADLTPQLKVVAKDENGLQATAWINVKGFQNASDFNDVAPKGCEFRSYDENSEKFVVDKKTNKRVESKERTAKLLENIGSLAACAGIDGEELEGDTVIDILNELAPQLIDASVGVKIRENSRGKIEVAYFMPSEKVTA